MNIRQLYIALLLFLTVGCTRHSAGGIVQDADSLFVPKYAKGFSIAYYGHSAVVTVSKPWQGAQGVDKHIFISRNGESAPQGFSGIKVDAPLKSVVCMSSSYVAFLDRLSSIDAVRGVSGVRYINNDTIAARYERGSVRDVGIDSGVNYELLSSLAPELVFVYGVGGESSVVTNKIAELNINIAYVGDYIESTALGKAEWIIFFAEFFDLRDKACQIFEGIVERYNSVKTLVSDVDKRPLVMLNAPWRDVWFVPSDSTYMVSLIEDAAAQYSCRGVAGDKSRPLSGEVAFTLLETSDFWLNPNSANTLAELKAENQKFASSKVVKQGKVFNNNLRSTSSGGSDFWENGVVMPDVVLLDLIRILHPEVVPNHKLYFYKELR